MTLTIFTSTFNRGHLIKRLYDSLITQNCQDFEWLIVDDGSSDDTKSVVKQLQNENKIIIRYLFKKNEGKHIAINQGVKLAKGELFFIVDSDDRLPNDAVQTVIDEWQSVLQLVDKEKYVGVAGLRSYISGGIIGQGLETDALYVDSIDFRFKHKIKGDKAEVFKTTILSEFPFPELSGEKFCSEALVWNRIAQKYKLKYFNKSIYDCEYIEGGLSSRVVSIQVQSPQYSMLYYSELFNCNKLNFFQKVWSAANFWRFGLHYKNTTILSKQRQLHSILGLATFPLGATLFVKDVFGRNRAK